ncbi:MAG: diguanylate cyclase, partial [Bacilli bacterium]|nr:diguanylate cyclase [Bacilli bacterium]
ISKLHLFNISKKYSYFKYVSILLFIWSFIYFLRLVLIEPFVIYYLSLAIYPLIFLLTAMLFLAILKYLDKPILKIYKIFIAIFFIADVVISFTNPLHELMLQLQPSSAITYEITNNTTHGAYFFVHTFVSYVFLLAVIIMIIVKLYDNVKKDQDILPFLVMLVGIIGGVALNNIQVFFYSFTIDPTYIAFVLIIMLLYVVIYLRDIKLILEAGGNKFIIDNLREMYVVVNQRDEIVDASDEFIKYFNLDLEDQLLFHDLLINIRDRAVVYLDPKDLKMEFDGTKRYLHMKRKDINIPLFKYTGNFYMFYDETEHQRFINEMNYVKSHDLMTGLYNRNYFEEIKTSIDEANQSYALIMFDLDGLKLYNDYLGHDAGDNLLINFAMKLKTIADNYDLIPIRMGGDEFILIALNMNSKMVDSVMEDIIKVLREQENKESILFSYGYAEREAQKEKLERVMSRADNVMYQMKIKNEVAKTELQAKLQASVKRDRK